MRYGADATALDKLGRYCIHNYDMFCSSNISNTTKSVSSDIQTLRSGLKKRGAAEFF